MSRHELYSVAAEICQADPDVRVVGSVGRSAYIGCLLPDIRDDGTQRNLNLLHCRPNNYQDASGRLHYSDGTPISTRFDNWVRFNTDTSVRLTFPVKPDDVYVDLAKPHETLAAKDIKIEGYQIRTLDPLVLDALSHLMYIQRPKDARAFAAYEDAIKAEHSELELSEFALFKSMMEQQHLYRLKGLGQMAYHRFLSSQTRQKLAISRRLPGIAPQTHGKSGVYSPAQRALYE